MATPFLVLATQALPHDPLRVLGGAPREAHRRFLADLVRELPAGAIGTQHGDDRMLEIAAPSAGAGLAIVLRHFPQSEIRTPRGM